MILDIGFHDFDCSYFQDEKMSAPVVRHVLVGPIRVIEGEEREGRKETIFFHGCSQHFHCRYLNCAYSWAARLDAKAKREKMYGTPA